MLWDTSLSGFGVTAFPSGKKVYCIQFRRGGRSHRISIGDHGRLTPGEARSQAKKLLGAVETGADLIEERRRARAQRTFREVSDEFLNEHVRKKRKRRTGEEYERLLRVHLLPAFGTRRFLDIKRADLARLHARLSDRPFAANRCLALISCIWNWAARRDEVPFADNPTTGIERNRERGRERYLTTPEIKRLGDALRLAETDGIPWVLNTATFKAKHRAKPENQRRMIDPFAIAALRLLILTGARLREVLDALWEHVDLERGIIHLADSKTGRKPIYLSAAAMHVLAGIPRMDGNPHIIPGSKFGKARPDLKRPWAAIASAAELHDVRMHDLRHTFASVGAGAGLGLPVIGKLLGHSQPATTHRYAHLDADPLRRASDRIGGAIAAALNSP